MGISSEDKKYSKKQERILKRRFKEQKRLEKGKEPSSSSLASPTVTISNSEDESSENSDLVKHKSEEELYRPSSIRKGESCTDLHSEPIAKNAVYNVLTEWDLGNKIVGMCFDTTSVNTGLKNGACVLLEHKVEEELLWLACRHHILEIVLSKVFTFCFGPSSSPDIPLFKRFKAVWHYINQDNYQPLGDIPGSEDFKLSAVNVLLAALGSKNQPRDDYMELILLLALGNTPVKVHRRAPGAVHHARWMAKLLYGIKIHLFHDEDGFKTTQKEKS